jgi:hypothetical protein
VKSPARCKFRDRAGTRRQNRAAPSRRCGLVNNAGHGYRAAVEEAAEDLTEDARQPGDPARAAQAIITAIQSPDTPSMLLLGTDALTWFRDAMKELSTDVDAWEQTSVSTDFPG